MKKTLLTAIAAISLALGANAQTISYTYNGANATKAIPDTANSSKQYKFTNDGSNFVITATGTDDYQRINFNFPAIDFSVAGNKPIVSISLESTQQVAISVVLVDIKGHVTDTAVTFTPPSPPNIFVVNANAPAKVYTMNFQHLFKDVYGNSSKPQGPVDSTKIVMIRLIINSSCYSTNPSYSYHNGLADQAYYKTSLSGTVKIAKIQIGAAILTGISETNVAENTVAVSPNPSTGNVNVSFNNNTSESASVSVVNVVGQEVYATKTTSSSVNLNLSELDKGVYFVRVQSAQGTTTKRLVLN